MTLGSSAGSRVERFLDARPTGPLMVCVGSASVAGIVWLARHSHNRPVTLLIGDMKSRNFTRASEADRAVALEFVGREDVMILSWYRTERSAQGRSEAHLKVWAACDRRGKPTSFLVGSANLTIAGLHENVELMALADPSEHSYLHQTLHGLVEKAWKAEERLIECLEEAGSNARERRHRHPKASRHHHQAKAPSGCGTQVLAVSSLFAAIAALLFGRRKRHR